MKAILFILCLYILIKIAPGNTPDQDNKNPKVEIKRKFSLFPGVINDATTSENGYNRLEFTFGNNKYEVILTEEGLANFEFDTINTGCDKGICKINKS